MTEADREAEIAIRAAIEAEYPDHAILGEELGLTGSGSCRWVLDPVDGIRPFICGLPVWGTLIGLTVDGRAEQGMMSQPFTSERFWATADGPGANMQASATDCPRETSARCRGPSCIRLRLSTIMVSSS
ncbi:fructose-1,6-bisphosphatase/inositol monophosphatase family enzyme [Bradyrhizobium sp. I1.8.5]